MTKPAPFVVMPLSRVGVQRLPCAVLWPWGVFIRCRSIPVAKHRSKRGAMAHAARIRKAIG